MAGITTHILDIARGRPAAGVIVRLEHGSPGGWTPLGQGETDADGRLRTLVPEGATVDPGRYRITFETGAYFEGLSLTSFYPEVSVVFEVRDGAEHHHVPLLLSPWGFSTYRGS